MRDIRDDLRQRLDALRSERDQLRAQLEGKLREIEQYEASLSALLELEERRVGNSQPELFHTKTDRKPGPQSTKADLEAAILDLLDGRGIMQHAAIKRLLEERGFGGPVFGRILQGTLMSLRSRNLVDLVDQGTWRRSSNGSAPQQPGHMAPAE